MPVGLVAVTGANGFVGQTVCAELVARGVPVRRLVRETGTFLNVMAVGEICRETDWAAALTGVDVIVHLAGRAHMRTKNVVDPLAVFRRVNVEGTVNLVRQAAVAGVRRFVFASSIKVNGEVTQPGQLFTADDIPAPQDPYGISKYEAELGLHEVAKQTGIDVVIIRPPLVYGPGVKANFLALVQWLARDIPLPLGAIHNNKRSLVALDNLVDLLITCVDHPAAANQTFLVSDGEDLSTTELLRRLGQAMGKPARLLPVPVSMLQWGAAMIGKKDVAQKLLGSLQVDISATCNTLDWHPPVSVDEGLRRCFSE